MNICGKICLRKCVRKVIGPKIRTKKDFFQTKVYFIIKLIIELFWRYSKILKILTKLINELTKQLHWPKQRQFLFAHSSFLKSWKLIWAFNVHQTSVISSCDYCTVNRQKINLEDINEINKWCHSTTLLTKYFSGQSYKLYHVWNLRNKNQNETVMISTFSWGKGTKNQGHYVSYFLLLLKLLP